MNKKSKRNIEDYLLIFAEIILILLFALLFYQGYHLYAIVFFIGAIVVWMMENDKLHLIVFWTLIISGIIVFFILNDYLLGIVIIIFGVFEMYLNSALRGNHQ